MNQTTQTASASVWREHASFMIRKYGYAEAKRRCRESINMNSTGTASSAFHVATMKEIELAATVGKVQS